MRGKCLDEGILQAYLDGELSNGMHAQATTHLAACEACARAFDAAQAETALFASVFAPDAQLNVPTDALRERVKASVAEMNRAQVSFERSLVNRFKSSLALRLSSLASFVSSVSLAPKRSAAFASLVAVAAFAVVFGVVHLRNDEGVRMVEKNRGESAHASMNVAKEGATENGVREDAPDQNALNYEAAQASAGVRETSVSKSARILNASRKTVGGSVAREGTYGSNANDLPTATPPSADSSPERHTAEGRTQAVAGEEKYLRAIASLERMIEIGGGASLAPSYRTVYERNLALVDGAIGEARKAVARNPKNAEAATFLFSAYQNKIDLMTTVADHAQVASLRD